MPNTSMTSAAGLLVDTYTKYHALPYGSQRDLTTGDELAGWGLELLLGTGQRHAYSPWNNQGDEAYKPIMAHRPC